MDVMMNELLGVVTGLPVFVRHLNCMWPWMRNRERKKLAIFCLYVCSFAPAETTGAESPEPFVERSKSARLPRDGEWWVCF